MSFQLKGKLKENASLSFASVLDLSVQEHFPLARYLRDVDLDTVRAFINGEFPGVALFGRFEVLAYAVFGEVLDFHVSRSAEH